MMLLAGDLGGTKTLLMLVRRHTQGLEIIFEQRYASADYPGLEPLVSTFLQAAPVHDPIDAACFAIAGPVHDEAGRQSAQLTNLPWRLDSRDLASALDIPRLALINDFAGIAYALDILGTDSLATLQTGHAQQDAPRLVAGAGTGFGLAAVLPGADGPRVLASESGHSGFAPADERQWRLWRFVQSREGLCTREHLLSGTGLKRVFDFMCADTHREPGPDFAEALAQGDPAVPITQFALTRDDPLARDTLALFCDVYAAQLGDLALNFLPHGGIYIAGGIAPRILSFLQTPRFIARFNDKPPMETLIRDIPLHVILDTRAGVLGAAEHAARLS